MLLTAPVEAALAPDPTHGTQASPWIRRWSHLVVPGGRVLDVACGNGRHLRYFHAQKHAVAGVDRAHAAIEIAATLGEAVLCDLESSPWPFSGRSFDAVVVTNYLWRPLLPILVASLAPGGVLLYETFADGQERFGRPSTPAFLLQPGELLRACESLHIVAYEDGVAPDPERRVQRIAAVRLPAHASSAPGEPGASPALRLPI